MAPQGLLLRACQLADLGEVVRLEKASFPERPYTRLDFAYYLVAARDGFLVASLGGRVAGYVIATSDGREGSIRSVAVLPELRGGGIGEALMRSALGRLAGKAERVSLLVSARNPTAIGLYRKLSFAETGRTVRGYYPDGSDALEMSRRL